MNFNKQLFYQFCSQLQIETKEQGLKKMGKLHQFHPHGRLPPWHLAHIQTRLHRIPLYLHHPRLRQSQLKLLTLVDHRLFIQLHYINITSAT